MFTPGHIEMPLWWAAGVIVFLGLGPLALLVMLLLDYYR